MTTQHERDEETGLDYRGARFYDGDVGRFLSLDPLAADFAAWSPYNYVFSNPVVFIDPTGKAPEGWSDDNIDLANRFGVFGQGQEFLDTQTNPPLLVSGDVTSARGNNVATRYPSSVEDFVNEVNKIPSHSTKTNVVDIVVDIPYRTNMVSLTNDFLSRLLGSSERYKANAKKEIQDYPTEIRKPLNQFIDSYDADQWAPYLEIKDLLDSYSYAREALENSGIKNGFEINVKVNIKPVGCGETNTHPCNVFEHSTSENTKIYYQFRRIPGRA